MIGIIGIRDIFDCGKNFICLIILLFVEFNFEMNLGNFFVSIFRDDVDFFFYWVENFFGYKKRIKGFIFLFLIDLFMVEIEFFFVDLKVDVFLMF